MAIGKKTSQRILGIALAAFAGAGTGAWAIRQFCIPPGQAEITVLGRRDAVVLPRQAVVYSFHGAVRCEACSRMEAWSRELAQREFSRELSAGTLRWQSMDFDAPANRHFVDDFKIVASTVVVEARRAGRPVRFRNLQKSLRLTEDRAAFENLLRDEIHAALEGE